MANSENGRHKKNGSFFYKSEKYGLGVGRVPPSCNFFKNKKIREDLARKAKSNQYRSCRTNLPVKLRYRRGGAV